MSWKFLALVSWIYDLKDKFIYWKDRRRYDRIRKRRQKENENFQAAD